MGPAKDKHKAPTILFFQDAVIVYYQLVNLKRIQERFIVYFQSGLDHYEKTGLCYHQHITEVYSLDQRKISHIPKINMANIYGIKFPPILYAYKFVFVCW